LTKRLNFQKPDVIHTRTAALILTIVSLVASSIPGIGFPMNKRRVGFASQ